MNKIHSTAIIGKNVKFGNNVSVGAFVIIKDDVRIGDNVEIKEFTRIDKGVFIGNNVQVRGHSVLCEKMIVEGNNDLGHELVCTNHPYLTKFNSKIEDIKVSLTIKTGASVGARVLLMPGITLGKNSIIGANSMVNKDVPDEEVWFGSPAKYVRKIKSTERVA